MTDLNTPRSFPNWEELYRTQQASTLPWFVEELDHDFVRALDQVAVRRGTALDVGTGPGTQAIALAKLGFTVTATDVSEAAIERARARAKDAGVAVTFVVDDVLASKVGGSFDLVLDRGCFHVIAPDRRDDYVRWVSARVVPGGYFFLKCFSCRQPGTEGPYRFRPEDLRALFAGTFELLSIEDSEFAGTLDPFPRALFVVLRRRA